MKNLTLTLTIKFLEEAIGNIQYDLRQDWNEEKEIMTIQLQSMIIAKANLEFIMSTGGQIFESSITK